MLRVILVILLLSLAMSCANQDDSSPRAAVSDSLHQVALASQSSDAKSALMTGEASVAQLAGDNSGQKQTSGRQIIYRASINLEVKSFAEADGKIAALVSDSGGFVSQFNEDRSYGTQRGGRWTIRIPGGTNSSGFSTRSASLASPSGATCSRRMFRKNSSISRPG